MAHSDILPEPGFAAVALQTSGLLRASPGLGGQPATISDTSVPVWVLGFPLGADDAEYALLRDLATPIGRWHHQVYIGEQRGYVRVKHPDDEDPEWRVTQLSMGILARRLDRAARWIDQKIETDPFVRLLIVPAYHLHAFWLLDEQGGERHLVVADVARRAVALRPLRLYSEGEFMEALRRGKPIIGIG